MLPGGISQNNASLSSILDVLGGEDSLALSQQQANFLSQPGKKLSGFAARRMLLTAVS